MTDYYKVYDIGEEVEERQNITPDQKVNINNLFRDFMSLPISKQYSLLTYDDTEHELKKLNNSIKTRDNLSSFSKIFADNLYDAETIKERDGTVRRNKNIKHGIFIIKYTDEKVIFLKLEEIQTINPEDFSRSSTYGGEKDYYKIAMMPFQSSETELYVDIIDANPRVAKYWSEGFLQLTPTRDSEINTEDLISLSKSNKFFNILDDIEDLKIKETLDNFLLENTNYSFEIFLDYFNNEHNKDYNFKELYKEEALNTLDESFVLDRKILDKYFNRVFQINPQVKIDINNIIQAVEGGQIDYDQEYGIIIPISPEFNIEEEMPQLL